MPRSPPLVDTPAVRLLLLRAAIVAVGVHLLRVMVGLRVTRSHTLHALSRMLELHIEIANTHQGTTIFGRRHLRSLRLPPRTLQRAAREGELLV